MGKRYAIVAENISKIFRLYDKRYKRTLDFFTGYRRLGEDFRALNNISFKVAKGESVAIVGVNGSGKSTLANIIAGVSEQTLGRLVVDGSPSLTTLSGGLNANLTGLENIELRCLMMGLTKKEVGLLQEEIIDCADLGDFINKPVKAYSTGMRTRLNLAIPMKTNSDILVIDEALSVSDQTFADSFKGDGRTVVYITHDLGSIDRFCDRVIWLNAGEIVAMGPVCDVLPMYQFYLKEFNRIKYNDAKKSAM